MEWIGLEFISALLEVLLVAGITFFASRVAHTLPARWSWRLQDPSTVVICASHSATNRSEGYPKPATGLGQLRALSIIVPSLARAYRKTIISQNVVLSSEVLGKTVEHDLILLGGSPTNRYTADTLERLYGLTGVRQDKDFAFRWKGDHSSYVRELEGSRVYKDYALVLRARNPYNPKRTLVILAGSSTFGTSAAARLFLDLTRITNFSIGGKDFVALGSCEVIDGYACRPTLIKIKKLPRHILSNDQPKCHDNARLEVGHNHINDLG